MVSSGVPYLLVHSEAVGPCDAVAPWADACLVRSHNHRLRVHPLLLVAVAWVSPPYAADAASDNSVVSANSDLLDWVARADPAVVGAEALKRYSLVVARDSVLRPVAAVVDWAFLPPALDCVVVQTSCLVGAAEAVVVVVAEVVVAAVDGRAGTVHAAAVALACLHSDSDHHRPEAYFQVAVHSQDTVTLAGSHPAVVGTVAVIGQPVDRATAYPVLLR